ncbi:fimbrillin family protein [Rikenella microfusus]|uniref:Fimbrillin family protein n=1 Tax=Rikenella microfusus TaxID=28139 RepID=A0A379MU10_9BACT|nr:fimbrillin family protein [Rikenella microfusus]SUE34337.1 Uncharacterised protein [Rikenella microfusus]
MKKILLSAMVVAALASCSKRGAENPADPGNEIKATASALDVTSKAPIIENFPSGAAIARVIASESAASNGDYTKEYQSERGGYMNFTDKSPKGFVNENGDTPNGKTYTGGIESVYLSALYPHTGWGDQVTTAPVHQIDGKTDIMATDEIQTAKTKTGELKFQHLLTQLQIKARANDDAAIAAWGNITGITLKRAAGAALANQVNVEFGNSMKSLCSGSVESLPFFNQNDQSNFSYSLTTDEMATQSTVATCLAPAVDATSGDEFQLSVTTEQGSTETLDISLKQKNGDEFSGNTQNYAFTIELTFYATEIVATASINPWTDAGSTQVDVGKN